MPLSLLGLGKQHIENVDDCKRLQEIILTEYGYELSLEEVQALWRRVSENACAGWLIVGDSYAVTKWLEDNLY